MNIRNKYEADQEAMRIARLIAGFMKQTLTPAENQELDDWINESDDNMELFDKLTDENTITEPAVWPAHLNKDERMAWLKQQIHLEKPRKKIPTRFLTIAIAASFILIASILVFKFIVNDKGITETANEVAAVTDLAPATNQAVLQLSNGTSIMLGTRSDSAFTEQNGTQINLTGNKIVYNADTNVGTELLYNVISTPRKGFYKLVLADGTGVWLNAASSIRYPASFIGNQRQVEVTGEVYFEVARNESLPFIVKTPNGASVKVLGTHFNVNAYSDEPTLKITLAEGSVLITKQNQEQLLKPGQQALIAGNANIKTKKVDLEEALAWKNNGFYFKNAPIEAIMRQVARWYDVEVVYEGKVNQQFNATIPRNVPVSKLLKLLEMTNDVHFIITNKTIIVKP